MKLCQTEMVEVDLLRKQFIGRNTGKERCRRDWFESNWLSEKMDASPRKNRCIYLSKGRSFGPITQLVEYYTFNVGVVGSIPAWPIMILWVVGLPSGKTLIYRDVAQLVEHLPWEQRVIGSNPVTPINLYECWNHARIKKEPKHGPSTPLVRNNLYDNGARI